MNSFLPVSVVVPLYNKARWIERTVRSVLDQTVSDFELIVVDDGSTDEGPDIVAGIRDSRIRLIRQENGGVSAARNRGFQEAENEKVALLDADDTWDPDFLEAVLALADRFPEAMVWGTGYRRVFSGGRSEIPKFRHCPTHPQGAILRDFFLTLTGPSPVCSSTAVVKRTAFSAVGGFRLGQKRMQDLDFWARVGAKFPIAFTPVPHASYYKDIEGQATQALIAYEDPGFLKTLEELKELVDPRYGSPQSVHDALCYHRLGIAANHIRAGNFQRAMEFIREAKGARDFRVRRIRWKLWIRARLHI